MTGGNGDERLGRLAEEVERILTAGEAPDAAALAAEFDVDEEDAADLIASLTAVGVALFADLEDEPTETWPELPDDFEIVEEIGRGGMGIVYRAEQKSLGRAVAVKVIRPGSFGLGDTVKRFRKEARSLARLRHPGIVSIHEVGHAGDAIYFTMDWIEGGSLADRLCDGRLNAGETVRILAQVASAIAHTHERGIIHRDLKPANVLIDRDGNAWVVDFGLALDDALSVDATGTGRILGTPAYMSPEQARGDGTAGEATDVYALGVLLYECLTGVTPFHGRPIGETIRAVQTEEPPAPSKLEPSIPRDLETIVLTAMSKEPKDRYATARALMEDLRAFSEGAPIRAKRPGFLRGVGRVAVRHRAPLCAAGLTSAAFLLVLILGLLPRLGLTPEELTATADRLVEEGEDAAALSLYEEAREKIEGESGDLDRRIAVARAMVRGRRARQRLFDGDVEGAAAEIEAVVKETDAVVGRDGWSPAPLLWDLYRVRVDNGEGKQAERFYDSLRKRLRDLHLEREKREWSLSRLAGGTGFDADTEALRQLFELAVETRTDPAPWGRISTGSLLSPWTGSPEHVGRATEYLMSLGNGGVEVYLDLVRAEATWPHPEGSGDRGRAIEGIGSALRDHRREGLSPGLIEVAADEGEHRETRAFALHLLCRLHGWPTIPRADYRREWASWDDAKSPALLAAVRDSAKLPREDVIRSKIEQGLALENAQFVRVHTGRFDPGFTKVRAWWVEVRDHDPRSWLAESVGLPAEQIPDAEALLAHLAKTGEGKRFRTHLLLALAAPAAVTPPHLPVTGREPERGIASAWRAALGAKRSGQPRRLRVAYVQCRDAEPPEILGSVSRPIRTGIPVAIEETYERVDPWSLAWQVPGIAGPRPVAVPRRIGTSVGFLLDDSPTGLRLSFGAVRQSNRGPAGSTTSGWSSSNRDVHEGMILTPTVMEGYSGSGGSFRNGFLLAVTESAENDPRPWTLDDWRAKLAENLRFLARGMDEAAAAEDDPYGQWTDFEIKYQQSIWLHPKIAAKIGLPGHAELLRGLAERDPMDRSEVDDWIRARLMAGDAAVLGEEGVAERLPDVAGDEEARSLWWSRLFLGTESPEIRAAAARVLGDLELRLPIAVRLGQAIRANGWKVPDSLADQVHGLGWRRAKAVFMGQPVVMSGALAFAAIALISLVLLGVLRLRGRPALTPAAGLILAGLGFLTLSVFREGVDLLSDEAGLAMALLGSALLARHAAGRTGWPSAIGFGAALVLTSAMHIDVGADVLRMLASLAIAVGVVALPRLAFGLLGGEPKRHPVFLLFYAGPVALLWASWGILFLTGSTRFTVRGDWLLAVFAAAALALLWAVGGTITAARARARRRAAPTRSAG